jgi:hypothetical protein
MPRSLVNSSRHAHTHYFDSLTLTKSLKMQLYAQSVLSLTFFVTAQK